jgi:hypothetical protein
LGPLWLQSRRSLIGALLYNTQRGEWVLSAWIGQGRMRTQ